MTTKPSAIAQIEAALAAGPTEGPWTYDERLGYETSIYASRGFIVAGDVYGDANGNYIAVCNPTSIREVLDHIAAQDAEIARLQDDLLPLQLFMDSVFGEFPEHGDIDGFDLQDIAESSGLVVKVNTITPCGESCCCAEAGVPDGTNTECLRVQLVMQRARIASAKHTAALTTKGTI